jgi:tetratricopeptide (TPR) repeat protein
MQRSEYRFRPATLVLAAFLAAAGPTGASTLVMPPQVPTSDATLRKAIDLLTVGDTARARAMVMPVLARNPDLAPAHEILGLIDASDGAFNAAIASFERAVELNPNNGTALTKLGDVHLLLGDRVTARGYFERALSILPDDRLTHQRLGLLAEEDGDTAAAIRHFEAGIRGTPAEYLGVKLNLALLYNATGAHDRALEVLADFAEGEQPALVHRALASAHLGLGETDAAVAQYRAALASDPADTPSRLGLGLALTAMGDSDGAIELLAPLHAADPSDADAALTLARAHRAADDLAAARAVLAVARAAADPAAPQLYAEEAALLMSEGETAEAEALWRALRDAHPQAVAGHLGLGGVLGFQRRYEEAAEVLDTGLALAPDHPGLLRAAARAAQQRGLADQALALAERLATTGAALPQDLFLKAGLEEAADAPETAMATYRALIAEAPEFWPALNNLAVLLIETGAAAEAVDLAATAHALAPDSVPVAHTLGWAQFNAGDAAAAAPLLAEAASRAPENAIYLAHLADAEFALGRIESARATLERARAAGLDDATAAALLARIDG